MKETIALNVNGSEREVEADPASPLLYVLRNSLELNGPKYGCGLEQCGACMVLMDGEARPSCRLPVAAARGAKIVTVEGLAGPGGELHPLQQAVIEEQAAQCGYCLNGMLICGAALLGRAPSPKRKAIDEGMAASLCRCGTHARFIRAIESAGRKMSAKERSAS